jgi:ABC-type sugar transport system substrate-binding protein
VTTKITVSLPERHNEFQALQTDEAFSTARRLGVQVEIVYADSNPILQIKQLLRAAAAPEKPSAMVVEPVTVDGVEAVFRQAAAAGIGIAVLNRSPRYLDELRQRYPKLALFTVSSDQVEIGRLQGRQVRALLPEGGTVLYVRGPETSASAQERGRGFDEIVGPMGPLRIISLYGQWTEASGEQVVRKWLSLSTSEHRRIDLVAAQDDSMARGARRAVEAQPALRARWARVPYLGVDGVPEVGRKLVDEAKLAGTVVMPSNTGAAIEHLARWAREGTMPQSVQLTVRSYPSEGDMLQRARKTA